MRFSCKSCGATFQTATGAGPKAAFACPACGGEMAASADVVNLNADRIPTRRYDLHELRARLEEEREESARARGTPRTAEQVWFAAVQGRQVGPLTSAGLQGLRARGQLSAATLVWREGWPAWVAAEAVGELRSVLGLAEERHVQPFPALPPAPPQLGLTYRGELTDPAAVLPAPPAQQGPTPAEAPAAPAGLVESVEPIERVIAPQAVLDQVAPVSAPAPTPAPSPALSLPFFMSPEPIALPVAPAAAPAPQAAPVTAAADLPSSVQVASAPPAPADEVRAPQPPTPGLDDGAPDTTDPGGPPSGMVPRGPGGRALPSMQPEPPDPAEQRQWGEKTVPDAPLPVFARGDITIPDAALPVFDDPPPLPSSARPPALPQIPHVTTQAVPAPAEQRPAESGPSQSGDAPGTDTADPGAARRRGRGKPRSNPPPRSSAPLKTLDLSSAPSPGLRPSRPPPQDEWFAPLADSKEVNKRPVVLAVAIVVLLLALAMILRAR